MKGKNKTRERGLYKKIIYKDKSAIDYVSMMEPRKPKEEALFGIWQTRMRLIMILLAAAVFLWMYCYISEPDQGMIDGSMLTRPKAEEEVSLHVKGDSQSGTWEKDMVFDVEERKFSDEEIQKLSERTGAYIRENLRGNNASLLQVSEKLKLVSGVPQTGVVVEWTLEDKYIRDDGTLKRSHIPKEGIDTQIMASAKWRNYSEDFYFDIHLLSPVYTDEQLAGKEAKSKIKKAIKEQPSNAVVSLPGEYEYSEEKESKSYLPVFLVIGLIAVMPIIWKEQIKRGVNKRQDEMISDHPGFINKVMLLLGAGLTLRYTIDRITAEYEREISEGGKRHYVYEELCVTSGELKDGISEAQAIENFGRRCRCMPYMRFASVITQNLKKGAEGILTILEKEASDSLVERKQVALRKGEVAGTKLLFPMIVMLGLVMAIIMVPAFMSM